MGLFKTALASSVFVLALTACGGEESEELVQVNSPTSVSTAAASASASEPAPSVANVADPAPTPSASAKVDAVVSWDIPQFRANGDDLPLSDIGGYEILYRPLEQTEYELVVIENQNRSEHVLEGLNPGEYEFLISAFDSDGLYSRFSEPSVFQLN